MPSRVLTVMFTDIKGFTERTSKSSRIELRDILQEHEDILKPILPEFGGRVVKTAGDSFMVAFESPTNAVLCGVMIQERLRERNENLPRCERLEVRIAINTGEVVEREGDLFGEAVNIAARIEGITEASEIYFTESVYLAMNKAEVPSSEVGLRRLKGLPEAVRVYRVIRDRNSEKYQQLVERLRSGVFADVAIPSTGEPPERRTRPRLKGKAVLAAGVALATAVVGLVAILLLGREPAPRERPAAESEEPVRPAPEDTPDPVRGAASAVRDAIEAGEFGLALARAETMLKEHPTRMESHDALRAVVEAEIRALLEKDEPGEAIELLKKRQETQEYVKFPGLEREVRLQYAASWARRGNARVAGDAYAELLRTYPDDLEVARAVLENMGPGSKAHMGTLSQWAARCVAGLTEGEFEESVARALARSLRSYHPEHERALEARGLLAERYPSAADILREELDSDDRNTRMNAYLFLKDRAALTPQEELRLHVKNLVKLRATDRYEQKYLERSLEYLERASSRPDWHERKKALGMGRVTRVASLRSSGELAERVSRSLAEAFLPEIKPSLMEWIEGDDYVLRARAFRMLRAAGLEGEIDYWAYHARNLALDDYSYQYEILHEAVAFFRERAGGARAARAREVLAKARETMKEHRETRSVYKVKNRLQNLEVNLKAVDEALEAFE